LLLENVKLTGWIEYLKLPLAEYLLGKLTSRRDMRLCLKQKLRRLQAVWCNIRKLENWDKQSHDSAMSNLTHVGNLARDLSSTLVGL
jgi:hypothetical protein